jgi:carboxyl-terminal processing protease
MKRDRSPRWPLVLVLSLLLMLPACRTEAPPMAREGATPTRRATPGSPTIRGTVVVPPAAGVVGPVAGTPRPDLTPAEATLLVDQAVGLLLDYSLNRPTSADLYQAAYDGALRAVARGGLLVDRELLPLSGDRDEDTPTFRTAYRALVELVRPNIGQTTLAHAAIRAAVDRADQCQTFFLDQSAFRQARDGQPATDGYGGIGVTLGTKAGHITTSEVYPDSPAARAGVLHGDQLLAVEGIALAARDAGTIASLLRGMVGTTVQVTILRTGEALPRSFTLTRAAVQPPSFTTTLLAGQDGQEFAFIHLTNITPTTLPLLREEIATLSGRTLQGWVLDLRGMNEGSLDLLPQVGALFVPQERHLGYVMSAGGGERAILPDSHATVAPVVPLAVLIDSSITLLGEALAAAAHDSAGARLFGEPTAGCVATSALYPLADGSGLSITLDQLLSPQRQPLHGFGQRPDELLLPDPTGVTDPVLAAALRWLADR